MQRVRVKRLRAAYFHEPRVRSECLLNPSLFSYVKERAGRAGLRVLTSARFSPRKSELQ